MANHRGPAVYCILPGCGREVTGSRIIISESVNGLPGWRKGSMHEFCYEALIRAARKARQHAPPRPIR